jgi:hypothetical protein
MGAGGMSSIRNDAGMTRQRRQAVPLAGLAGALALVGAAGCAQVEPVAGYTPPPKGFKVILKRQYPKDGKPVTARLVHTVLKSNGEEVLYGVTSDGAANGDRVHLFRGIFSYAYHRPGQGWAEHKFDRAALRGLWPLAPGREATVKMQFGYGAAKTLAAAKADWHVTETGTIHFRILRRETVTTPQGAYDTFVIQRDARFTTVDGRRVNVQRRTAWFAPKLGYIVRQTVRTGPEGPAARRSRIDLVAVE